MATGTILLPIGAAIPPDGSTNNAAAAILRVKSSAAAPSLHFLQANFDATTKEFLYWSFRMPSDYASGPTLKVQYKMASATSGNVVIEGRLAAITPTDATDGDAKALGSANTTGANAVAGTAGYVKEISLALTNDDSLAAGDWATVMLARAPADANDTASGDMEVIAVSLEYVTA